MFRSIGAGVVFIVGGLTMEALGVERPSFYALFGFALGVAYGIGVGK